MVDKPTGPTSHDVVQRVRRTLRQPRAGHTGTLDPFASGVLPVCLGRATRLARFLSAGEKAYRATVRLGFATATDDLSGETIGEVLSVALDPARVRQALVALTGEIDQHPPLYSAKHVDGRRAYELARAGQEVERAAVRVTVHAIDLVEAAGDRLVLDVRCGPGTYVRAIARDLGHALGVGGHLVALRRTRSGGFDLAQAVPLDEVDGAAERVIPPADALGFMPAVRLSAQGMAAVRHGRDLDESIAGAPLPDGPWVRLLDADGALIAVASGPAPVGPRVLHPAVVLVDGH